MHGGPLTIAGHDDEELGCAECAAPKSRTWPLGSDICTRCWELAEAEDLAEAGPTQPDRPAGDKPRQLYDRAP